MKRFFLLLFLPLQVILLNSIQNFGLRTSMGSESVKIQYENNCVYVGSVKQNIPEGQGKASFQNGDYFEGLFINGEPKRGTIVNKAYQYQGQCNKNSIDGVGVLKDRGNITYDGVFKEGKFISGEISKKNEEKKELVRFKGEVSCLDPFEAEGQLTILKEELNDALVNERRVLKGHFKKGNLDGQGTYKIPAGDQFEGEFASGRIGDNGAYKSSDFTIIGQFRNQQPQGQVQVQFSNGDKYIGKMKDSKPNGFGKYTYKNGTYYEGDFYCGTMWGQCIIEYPKESEIQKYEGEVNEGSFNGIGVLYYSNGVIYKGYFLQGAKHGYGVLIYGSQKYKCLYIMDELAGELKIIN